MFFIVIILFLQPLKDVFYYYKASREKEDLRSIMQIFKNKYKKGDDIFLNRSSIYGFGYYHGILGMGEEEIMMEKNFFKGLKDKNSPKVRLARYYFNEEGFLEGYIKEKSSLLKTRKKIKKFG